MPLSYQINKERRLVITTARDVLTSPEALEHMRQLSSDPDFNRDFFQLLDLTRVTGIREEKIFLLELCTPHIFSRGSRRAVVAASPLTFGLSRRFISMREAMGGAEQMQVFKTGQAALLWLFEGDH
jgi:hypothetical protein